MSYIENEQFSLLGTCSGPIMFLFVFGIIPMFFRSSSGSTTSF